MYNNTILLMNVFFFICVVIWSWRPLRCSFHTIFHLWRSLL